MEKIATQGSILLALRYMRNLEVIYVYKCHLRLGTVDKLRSQHNSYGPTATCRF